MSRNSEAEPTTEQIAAGVKAMRDDGWALDVDELTQTMPLVYRAMSAALSASSKESADPGLQLVPRELPMEAQQAAQIWETNGAKKTYAELWDFLLAHPAVSAINKEPTCSDGGKTEEAKDAEVQFQRRRGTGDGSGGLQWDDWQICTEEDARRVDGLRSWQWRKIVMPASGVHGDGRG